MGGPSHIEEQNAFQALQHGGATAEDFGSWLKWFASQQTVTPSGQSVGDIWQWLNRTPPAPAQQQAQPTATAPTGQGVNLAQLPQGVDPAVVQAIVTAAKDEGVDPRLALAMAQQESGLNPSAVGDQGTSFGLFQLHQGGELTSAGLDPQAAMDPYTNARVALAQVAQVARQHPDWSPGQIAAAAQRPADQTSYASSVNTLFDSVETGQGTLGWANQALSSTTFGGLGTPANQLGGTSPVPVPFPVNYFQSPSLSFGDQWQGETEQGVDYPMPEGTQLVSPVGGTIHLEDSGDRNWGKRVMVTMPNGWTFAIGHIMDFTVTEGEAIAPGEVLGTSGGGPKSSSPGFSSGPHIEAQFIDPSGKFQDPAPFLQQAYAGTTFATWMGGMFLGSSQVQGTPQSTARTPDGRLVDYNTPEGQWYKTVDSVWQSVYGQHAPLQASVDFRNAGVTTVDALQNAVNQLPSAVPGVNIGAYKTVSDATNKQAQTAFGRPVPQSLLNDFFRQGITTASDIKAWFDFHSSSDVPTADYQAIYDSALPYTQNLYGDVPHPADIAQAWQQAGGVPASAPTSGGGGAALNP